MWWHLLFCPVSVSQVWPQGAQRQAALCRCSGSVSCCLPVLLRAVVGYGHAQFESFVWIISPLPFLPSFLLADTVSVWQQLLSLASLLPSLTPWCSLSTHTRRTGILCCCPRQYIRIYPQNPSLLTCLSLLWICCRILCYWQ